MSVKIGHASISETGGINGTAGDQTGREVCTRDWYDGGWTVLLRPKKAEIAEASAKACEAGCANNNIGYSQFGSANRNTAHDCAKAVKYDLSKIKTKCNTDCSAFMTLCALAGGVKKLEYTGNAPTTITMRSAFYASREYDIIIDSKYLRSDSYLKRGDVLVKEGSHTVMVLSDGPLTNAKVTKEYASKLTGVYKTITSLHLREDAGVVSRSLVVMPGGTKVSSDGNYKSIDGKKWLHVTATVGGKTYVGYCSHQYLKR